jgi:hypothetical protein
MLRPYDGIEINDRHYQPGIGGVHNLPYIDTTYGIVASVEMFRSRST